MVAITIRNLLLLVFLAVLCGSQDTPITGILAASPELSTVYSAIRLANLNFVLEGVGPFTLFAPTNLAFRLLGPGVAASLTHQDNMAYLTQVLQYHVCYGNTVSQQLLPGQELSTFEGERLTVNAVTPFTVNDVPISRQDLLATNGLVHTMNRVFLPPNFALPDPTMDIVQLVASEDYLTTMNEAILLAELESTLKASGPLTVFVPTNTAFENLGPGIATSLLLPPNKKKLEEVLLHHVVTGVQSTAAMPAGVTLQALGGGALLVTQNSPLKIDSVSTVISPNVPASNGVLHVMDAVILPSGFVYPDKTLQLLVQQSPELSLLAAAASTSSVSSLLSGSTAYTLFAPTNEAFEKLGIGVASSLLMPANQDKLTQVLRYHFLQGGLVRMDFSANTAVQTVEQSLLKISSVNPLIVDDTAGVRVEDIPATNGVMHIVNKVLLPPGFRFPDKDVVQLADSTASLSTFNTLVALAGLRSDFTAEGPYTVFAPTDAAFAALDKATLEALQQAENKNLLQRVLRYHVISGRTDSTLLRYGRDIQTIEGGMIRVTPWTELGWQGVAYQRFQPPVTLNTDVQVSTENALATNGIVHFVNKVLLPPGMQIVSEAGMDDGDDDGIIRVMTNGATCSEKIANTLAGLVLLLSLALL
ncbi:TGFBI [Symbiodinium natans]|uniref:TGFBI protein n=1 Tax=Symbiodinium natans TaxID=878477 RepID=A0A812H3W8_9DINO|nr:TGFBI [Symbiodinium natans]